MAQRMFVLHEVPMELLLVINSAMGSSRTLCAVPFILEVMLRKNSFHEERGCTQLASCNAVCLEGLAQNIMVLVQEGQELFWCIVWRLFVHQCLERLAFPFLLAFSLVFSNYTFYQKGMSKQIPARKQNSSVIPQWLTIG